MWPADRIKDHQILREHQAMVEATQVLKQSLPYPDFWIHY